MIFLLCTSTFLQFLVQRVLMYHSKRCGLMSVFASSTKATNFTNVPDGPFCTVVYNRVFSVLAFVELPQFTAIISILRLDYDVICRLDFMTSFVVLIMTITGFYCLPVKF